MKYRMYPWQDHVYRLLGELLYSPFHFILCASSAFHSSDANMSLQLRIAFLGDVMTMRMMCDRLQHDSEMDDRF